MEKKEKAKTFWSNHNSFEHNFHKNNLKGLCACGRRAVLIILMLVMTMTSVFALSFTSRLLGVTTHPDFWAGVFPSSVHSFIGIDGITLLEGRKTEVGAEIATGTLARTITVNPTTGEALNSSNTEDALILKNSYYDVMYASWKAGIAQGIGWSEQAQADFLTLRFSIDGQWEVALDPLMQSVGRAGRPFATLTDIFDPNSGIVLQGTPDLSGDRRLLSLSFDLYGKLNYLLLKTGSTSGIALEFKFTWAPSFMNFSKEGGGVADFWKFWLYGEGGLMIYQAVDERGMNKWSLGLSDNFEMRVFGGDHIPEYARTLKGRTWWYEPENMTFMARNVVKLDYYGQQFFGSCIPYAYAFFDLSFSGGQINNIKGSKVGSVWAGSIGMHFELQLFGFVHMYYELGRIFLYTGDNPDYAPGFKLSNTIRVSVSVSGGAGDIDWST